MIFYAATTSKTVYHPGQKKTSPIMLFSHDIRVPDLISRTQTRDVGRRASRYFLVGTIGGEPRGSKAESADADGSGLSIHHVCFGSCRTIATNQVAACH